MTTRRRLAAAIVPAGGALALILALAPTAAPAQSGGYRKVDPATGYGNCLFSPMELGFKQEGSAAYRAARTSFTEGESIHIRCYWPRKLATYRTAGKLSNELRDQNRYSYGLVWVMPDNIGGPDKEVLIQDMASPDANEAMSWDQQRFDLYDDNPGCDVKVKDGKLKSDYGVTSPNRCLNLANFARKMMVRYPAIAGQRTFRFCFRQYVEVADSTATYTGRDSTDPTRRRSVSTTMQDSYPVIIAQSCFDYRLKN